MEQRVDTQIEHSRDRSTQYDKYSPILYTYHGMDILALGYPHCCASNYPDLAAITAILTTLGGDWMIKCEATLTEENSS